MKFNHESGILLHPTSLPGRYGIGEFGPAVLAWLDQLRAMGQRLWQVLPLGPTGYGDSPYQSTSAFAGNSLLIGLEWLREEGLLTEADLAPLTSLPTGSVEFEKLIPIKGALLQQAAQRFLEGAGPPGRHKAFEAYCGQEAWWLDDFAIFTALKERQKLRPWFDWPARYADYTEANRDHAQRVLDDVIQEHKVLQFYFDHQWRVIRDAARARGIRIVGDLPIFVAHDSADVWSRRDLFLLDKTGCPLVVAGVPPDYFSVTGQRWGNPLYRWPVHEQTGFAWWRRRMEKALEFYDAVRVDHFRGFVAHWEIPASEPVATRGRWVPAPGRQLFERLRATFRDRLHIIAEDLGVVGPDVEALRDDFGLPGMRILQFAFGDDPMKHMFVPEAYVSNCVAYTGTHDNDTVVGWFHDRGTAGTRSPEQCAREREACRRHLGIPGEEIHWELISILLHSCAGAVVVPLQDVLGLGTEARMNIPGTMTGNWRWRLADGQLTEAVGRHLLLIGRSAGRNVIPVGDEC